MKFELDIKRIACKCPSTEYGHWTEEEASDWWNKTGQHSDFFRIRIVADTPNGNEIKGVESPKFDRRTEGGRKELGDVISLAAIAIKNKAFTYPL